MLADERGFRRVERDGATPGEHLHQAVGELDILIKGSHADPLVPSVGAAVVQLPADQFHGVPAAPFQIQSARNGAAARINGIAAGGEFRTALPLRSTRLPGGSYRPTSSQ